MFNPWCAVPATWIMDDRDVLVIMLCGWCYACGMLLLIHGVLFRLHGLRITGMSV